MTREEVFQFTHPGKGATVSTFLGQAPHSVSIHAPWEGCDKLQERVQDWEFKFQFTHPGRGATVTGVSSSVV